MYTFPWLKYLVDAPSYGADYLLQATYKPNKQLEWYVRYRSGAKGENYNPDFDALSPVVLRPINDIREQVNYKISNVITLRNSV